MKARPILFSAPMVRALLAGNKTQTRRIFKGTTEHKDMYGDAYLEQYRGHEGWKGICPHGQIGDYLYVREAFSYDRLDTDHNGLWPAWYWADGDPDHGDWTKPKPSIHQPRLYSRLTLKITDVRVERINEISHRDALAEGVNYDVSKPDGAPISRFKHLWESINGAGSWRDNPWVWALTFEVIQQNVDEVLK